MKKLLFGIFICFGLIFAMSHNVSAIDLTIDLDNYNLSRNLGRIYLDMYVNDSLSCNGVASCTVYNTTDFAQVKKFTTHSDYSYKAGDLVILRAFIGSQNSSGSYTNIVPFIQQNFTTNNNNVVFLGYNEHQVNSVSILSQLGYGPNANEFYTQITSIYNQLSVIEYYFRVQVAGNYQIGFESTNYAGASTNIFNLASYSANSAIYFRILGLTAYSPVQSKQEQAAEKELESTENIENQTPPSSNQTGDGQSATNLIGAFSGFVSALGGLSATNCNLTLNFPDFAGGSRVVNVCQNKDKAGNIISVFSSLTLIIFYVPLAIRLLTMIYNEIRSFTNG